MARRLQQLLGADGDLADEDFLSAVEDAENRFGSAGPAAAPEPPPPPPPRLGLRPLSGRDGGPGPRRGAAEEDEDNALLVAACAELEAGAGPAAPGAPRAGGSGRQRQDAAPGAPGAPRAPGPAPPRAPPAPPGAPGLFQATGSPSGRAPPPPPPREAAPLLPVVTNHLVRLVAAASRAPRAQPGGPERRRFPGPAGILPRQRHSGRHLDEILVSAPQTPAHGALAKLRPKELPGSPPAAEEDFGKGPWVAMKTELGLDERDPGCFLRTYSVVMVLRKAALKQLPKNKVPSMAVMIKTLTRSNVDAGAVFRDPTGEMQGTVHRVLLEQRPRDLRPGSVLLLKQVGVFSPSHRNHYLNVTPNNLLKIYPPEGEGGSAQAQQPAVRAGATAVASLGTGTHAGDGSARGKLGRGGQDLLWSPFCPARCHRPLPGLGCTGMIQRRASPRPGDRPGAAAAAPSGRLEASRCTRRALGPGTGSRREPPPVTWTTWTGSWASCPTTSGRRRRAMRAERSGERAAGGSGPSLPSAAASHSMQS